MTATVHVHFSAIPIFVTPVRCIASKRGSSMIECLTRDRGVACSHLTSITVLCTWAGHINPCLVLDQPRKTYLDVAVNCWLGRKESDQTSKSSKRICNSTSHEKVSTCLRDDLVPDKFGFPDWALFRCIWDIIYYCYMTPIKDLWLA